MKAVLFAALALATAFPAFAQYSARTLTRKVVPQPQQPARPAPRYAPVARAVAPRVVTAAETARVKADKSKNEVKQFEYYKRRADEGSDHAQYQLALRYLNGKGTDPDQKLAREWLAKASKQGNKKAAAKLIKLGPEPKKVAAKKAIPTVKSAPRAAIADETKAESK